MARIYQTRNLLDPQMIAMANQSQQNQYNAGHNRIGNITNAVGNALTGLAQAGTDAYNTYKENEARDLRERTVNSWNIDPVFANDPVFKAAREEYIRTGSTGPLSQLKMQMEAAKARENELAIRKQEAAALANKQAEINLNEARPKYMELVNKMLTGEITPNEKQVIEAQLKDYETRFPGIQGTVDREALAQGIEQQRIEEKKANDKEMMRADNALDEMNQVKTMLRNPKLTPEQRDAIAKDINDSNKYPFMNQEERTALRKEVYGTETQKEATSKNIKGTIAGIAGESVKKAHEKSEEEKLNEQIKTELSNYSSEKYADARRKAEELSQKYNKKFRATGTGGNFKVVME